VSGDELMPGKRYTRKMSYNDRLFAVGAEICPPGLNQFVAEGEGIFDVQKWRDAVERASEAGSAQRRSPHPLPQTGSGREGRFLPSRPEPVCGRG